MCSKAVGLKLLVFLFFITVLIGCSNDSGEVSKVKADLEQAQNKLDKMTRRYNAVSTDYSNEKKYSNDLENQLRDSIEQITILQQQINELNGIIIQQEQIIADQESALKEFMDMLGQPATDLPANY